MILDDIAVSTEKRVMQAKERTSLESIKKQVELLDITSEFPFKKALKKQGISFICEVKKASPSKGVIAEEFPHVEIAKDYEKAGADCISVLTETQYFQGNNVYLKDIRKQVKVPLLRKDFTIDEYQIYEAKTLGADAVLLICTLLSIGKIREYIKICDSLGLSALIEVHDETEIQKALNAGARIIGVNNRNLKDFTVDINNSITLRKSVPDEILFVAESGIKTPQDIRKLQSVNVNAVLIGETLMLARDKKETLNMLRGKDNDSN